MRNPITTGKVTHRSIQGFDPASIDMGALRAYRYGRNHFRTLWTTSPLYFRAELVSRGREFDPPSASLGKNDYDLDEHRGKLCLRCDPLSCREQAVRQHDLSLSVVPQVGSVARRRVANLRKGCVPLHPWAAFGLPLICVSQSNILRVMWDAMTYENTARTLEIDVTTCSLDAPEAFPPTYHAWLHDDLLWVRFGDNLERFPESKS
jgi:hypothetical protein